jgi:hypothetical protein
MLRIFLFGLSNRRRTAGSQQPERYVQCGQKPMKNRHMNFLQKNQKDYLYKQIKAYKNAIWIKWRKCFMLSILCILHYFSYSA